MKRTLTWFSVDVGYAVPSSSSNGDAEIAKAKAQLQKSYIDYKLGVERNNIEREKKKLPPVSIMTLHEWLQQQSLPENVRKDLEEKKMITSSATPSPDRTQ